MRVNLSKAKVGASKNKIKDCHIGMKAQNVSLHNAWWVCDPALFSMSTSPIG